MRASILTALACVASLGLQAQHNGPAGGASAGHMNTTPVQVSAGSPGSGVHGGGSVMTRTGEPGGRMNTLGREQAHGFNTLVRPVGVPYPRTENIIVPGPIARCTLWPTNEYWKNRDLMAVIQSMARWGYVPTYPDAKTDTVTGRSWNPAGWVAYAFVVPPKGKLHVRLHHPNEGWFRLVMMDRWGLTRRQGMLQNLIPTGNPEVSYFSPLKQATTVYVIVDDPGWMSQAPMDPFVLHVDRDWNPDKTPTPADPPVFGIWAKFKDKQAEPAAKAGESKPAPAENKPAPAA